MRARWRRGGARGARRRGRVLVVKAASFGGWAPSCASSAHARRAGRAAGRPGVRAGLRCGALTFPTYRLVPDARWLLDADADRVRSRAGRDASARPARSRSTSQATRSSSGASAVPTACRGRQTVRSVRRAGRRPVRAWAVRGPMSCAGRVRARVPRPRWRSSSGPCSSSLAFADRRRADRPGALSGGFGGAGGGDDGGDGATASGAEPAKEREGARVKRGQRSRRRTSRSATASAMRTPGPAT